VSGWPVIGSISGLKNEIKKGSRAFFKISKPKLLIAVGMPELYKVKFKELQDRPQ